MLGDGQSRLYNLMANILAILEYFRDFNPSRVGLYHSSNVHLSLRNACKHQGHKRDPKVTPKTCVLFGKGTQVYLILDVGSQASRKPPTYKH